MRLPAEYVSTDDLVFTGAAFVAQWDECTKQRGSYAYIIPLPDDPTWPMIEAYFSRTRFTRRELRQLCQYDYAPLEARKVKGEEVCGFRWALDEVALEAVSDEGQAIMEALDVTRMRDRLAAQSVVS